VEVEGRQNAALGQSGAVFGGQGKGEDGPVDGLSQQTGIAHPVLVGAPVLQPGEGGLRLLGGEFLPLGVVLEAIADGISHRLGQGLPAQLDSLSLGSGRHQGGWGAVVLQGEGADFAVALVLKEVDLFGTFPGLGAYYPGVAFARQQGGLHRSVKQGGAARGFPVDLRGVGESGLGGHSVVEEFAEDELVFHVGHALVTGCPLEKQVERFSEGSAFVVVGQAQQGWLLAGDKGPGAGEARQGLVGVGFHDLETKLNYFFSSAHRISRKLLLKSYFKEN